MPLLSILSDLPLMKDHLFSEKYFILICITGWIDVMVAETLPNGCTFRIGINKVARYINFAGESEMRRFVQTGFRQKWEAALDI